MIFWNEAQRTYIRQFFDRNLSSKNPLFILLIGQKGLWKTSFIESFSDEILGVYKRSDFLYIRDCSEELEKTHTIQIETPTTQKTIQLANWEIYENRGVREINSRLQQSAISGKKILFIENLERMTVSAMNAFLKTCEEPLSQRFIFATIDSENWVLPTIVSRALLVHFNLLDEQAMRAFLKSQDPDISDEKLGIVLHMSWGKPWIGLEMIKKMNHDSEIEKTLMQGFKVITEKKSYLMQIDVLKKIKEIWLLAPFINTIIDYFTSVWDSTLAQKWINLKKFQAANISEENSRWYTVLG